jgi:hypothetical protein
MQLESDLLKLNDLLNNLATYQQKSNLALQWSRKYTLDFFESEIKKLLQS